MLYLILKLLKYNFKFEKDIRIYQKDWDISIIISKKVTIQLII